MASRLFYVLLKLKNFQVSTEYKPLKQRTTYKIAYNQHVLRYSSKCVVNKVVSFKEVQTNNRVSRLSVNFLINYTQLVYLSRLSIVDCFVPLFIDDVR